MEPSRPNAPCRTPRGPGLGGARPSVKSRVQTGSGSDVQILALTSQAGGKRFIL